MASNLLLVDESPLIHRVVELTLETHGVSVYSADDAEEALTLARSLKPDIILASTSFKGRNGLEFCRDLGAEADLADIPVLLLASAKDSLSDDEVKEAGASGVLTKPFEPENLLAEVGKALSWTSAAEPEDTGVAEEVEAAGSDEDDALADFGAEPEIEDPLAEFGEAEEELLGEPPVQDVGGDPFAQEQDEAMSDAEVPAPAGETPESGSPLEDMNLDELLDDFDSEAPPETAPEPPASEEEETSSENEETDPTMLAIEHTLAEEFESLGDADSLGEDSGETEEEADPAALVIEDTLAEEFDPLTEEGASPGGELLSEVKLDDAEEELEAAEAEIAGLQADIAAEFEGDESVESSLEHFAEDQVQAAADELASLEAELSSDAVEPSDEDMSDEIAAPSDSEFGTSAMEAGQLLEEAAFRESGTLQEEAENAPSPGMDEFEVDDEEDAQFWENLEFDADTNEEKPPESPEIYTVPQGDEPTEIDEEFSLSEVDSAADEISPHVEQSLERTVEAIVPAILQRIEALIVEKLPDMVEKIVLREIEKIKRGE